MKKYDPAKIEKKWQTVWAKKGVYKTKENTKKKKFYALDMFPYPSGEGLHVGHPKGYIATDVVSRYRRMKGDAVLHPMGFDAFGLPAENYAIKTKTNPVVSVKKNVARYKKQLEILGLDYDWSREVNTTDPNYYRWTQWIFLQLYKKGLAYESNEPVNWCPVDKTVLANEDVENGHCERCGALVEKKPLRQWVLKITDYADRMLYDLDALDETNMPHVVDRKNPPIKGKKKVARRTVHALVIDPKTKKLLCVKWKKFPWTGLPIGGIEAGENIVEAARREVHEETGYKNLKFIRVLGGVVRGEYFAAHKDENRVAYSSAVLFELENEDRDEVGEEEKAKHEAVWIDPQTINHDNFTCAEWDIWKERLDAEIIWNKETGVPCFIDKTPDSAFRDNMPIKERNAVMVVLKHWKEDKYLGLKWKKVNWRTNLTGGPEGDETLEQGAIKEIREETGYQNPKLKRVLGNLESKFFHGPKQLNRHARFTAMYFELKDEQHVEISDEEKANHEIVWLTKDEMSDFLDATAQRYMWDVLFLKKPNRFLDTKPMLDWPESIKEAQRNWIGRSEGASIKFEIVSAKHEKKYIEVFTTRADTLFGVTYVVLAPEHPLVKRLLNSTHNSSEVQKYIGEVARKTEIERTDVTKEKTGVEMKGLKAVNPANGYEVPVWVADYVLADYGTGAVMAVPAHDERDFAFAKKYNLPIKKVVDSERALPSTSYGKLVNSGGFDGMSSDDAKKKITEKFGQMKVTYKLRDWVFSRQRYWGEPIPMVHCARCAFKKFEREARATVSVFDAKTWQRLAKDPKTIDVGEVTVSTGDIIRALNRKTAHELLFRVKEKTAKGNVWNIEAVTVPVPVPEKNLPVKLPPVKSYEPTGTGESPLAAVTNWVNTKCPKCGGPAKRETNTMPNWAGSSWYYLRFEDPKNKTKLVGAKADKYWSPVDLYVGGAEHATRHLIYARFWHKFLYDLKSVSTIEPFKKLQNVGLIMAEDGRKMSKRFGNVVNPDDIVKTYGADTLRMYEMFMGPFDQSIAWSTTSMVGPRRFIERVWALREKVALENDSGVPRGAFSNATVLHKAIKKVTEDIEGLRFNTAISTLMITVNEIEKGESIGKTDYEILLKLLAPFAPHVVEELWMSLGNAESIHLASWPAYDPKLAQDAEMTIIVQVNGKVRSSFKAGREAGKEELEKTAKDLPEIKKWIEGKEIKKTIVVPGKLVNFVL